MPELAVKLKKTHDDMGLVGKMTRIYVSAYNNHLVDRLKKVYRFIPVEKKNALTVA